MLHDIMYKLCMFSTCSMLCVLSTSDLNGEERVGENIAQANTQHKEILLGIKRLSFHGSTWHGTFKTQSAMRNFLKLIHKINRNKLLSPHLKMKTCFLFFLSLSIVPIKMQWVVTASSQANGSINQGPVTVNDTGSTRQVPLAVLQENTGRKM